MACNLGDRKIKPGTKIHKLTVLRYLGAIKKRGWAEPRSAYTCLCECGKKKTIRHRHLITNNTKTCGCLSSENYKKLFTVHGKRWTIEYRSWASIRYRCLNPKARGYEYWGGRGIKICKRWGKFENFFNDMGKRPSIHHSIDRINNDGDYKPSNCRWATSTQQNNNRRTKRWAKRPK